MSKQAPNTYTIKYKKEKATEVAENRELGQTDSNKMNLAL